jgi:glucose-1-phosphate cytidylyltransferase
VKVVLFCGGLGLRLRELSQRIPKPMIPVGTCPILLHVMKYYAHFGHRDFILCLGYRAAEIQAFFEQTRLGLPSAYLHPDDHATREAIRAEIEDWRITFADTGLHANIGQRLRAVRELVADEPLFLANYADVLTDASLPDMIERLEQREMVASFLCARPTYSFHVVSWSGTDRVSDIRPVNESEVWLNGGYFVLRREIFDLLGPDDELVERPFRRLLEQGKLLGYRHTGFWAPMDTLKDRQNLDEMYERGDRPWALWEQAPPAELKRGELKRAAPKRALVEAV